MNEQPSNLNVYEEMSIIQGKVNTTNLHLQRLHNGHKETNTRKEEEKS